MQLPPDDGQQWPEEVIIEPNSGYAVNIPLSFQEPAEFWQSDPGKSVRNDIEAIRQALGIQIDDNLVTVQPSDAPLKNALDYYKENPDA